MSNMAMKVRFENTLSVGGERLFRETAKANDEMTRGYLHAFTRIYTCNQ